MKTIVIALTGGAVIAALVIGIAAKLAQQETEVLRQQEPEVLRILQVLEKDPKAAEIVGGFLYLKDRCEITYPRPLQTAFERYVRVHPEAGPERVIRMGKNGMEATGIILGEQLFSTSICPVVKQRLEKFAVQSWLRR